MRSPVFCFFFSFLVSSVVGQSLTALMRSDVAGYGSGSNTGKSRVRSPAEQNSIRPPPPPAPPAPPLQNGQGSFDQAPPEPAFGPPNMMGMSGASDSFGNGPPGMPATDGLMQMPSLSLGMFMPQQPSGGSAAFGSSPNQFGNPEFGQGVPAARNDQSNFLMNPGPQDANYAYPSQVPGLNSGTPLYGPRTAAAPQQQLMLGGFPYTSPLGSRSNANSFVPPVTPQPSGDYAYDWTYKSPNAPESQSNQLFGAAGNKGEILSVRDLLAPQLQPTMPPQPTTTAAPPKRCIPDDFPEAKGLCASRENRRSRCGGLISSVSNDCSDNELCCYRIDRFRNASRPVAQAKAAAKSCKSPIASGSLGFCALRGERGKICSGLLSSPSIECENNEVCCFSGSSARLPASLLPAKQLEISPAMVQAAETPCAPAIRPSVLGFCTKRVIRSRRCQGLLLSSSENCQVDELCCFSLNASNTRQAVATTTKQPNYSSYGSMTTAVPSWNPGAATVPYYLPYTPQNLCVPATDSTIFNGVCVASTMIQYLCTGLQAASSLNCGASEYCCYAAKALQPPPTNSGCIPDNNPNIANGFCTSATDLATKCNGISISASRYCPTTQYCCYSNSIIIPATTLAPYPGVSTTTSNYNGGGGVTGKTCTPQGNQMVKNGSCVAFAQISQVCKSIQISPSLDCGVSEYCCFTQPAFVLPPPPIGCSPITNPSLSNGTCVAPSQLATACKGIQFAASSNCLVTEFCCYSSSGSSVVSTTTTTTTIPITSTTMKTTTSALYTVALPKSNCSPDTNPMVSDGKCMDSNQLATICKGMQISTSGDCMVTQFCCFTSALVTQTPSTGTTISYTMAGTTATPASTTTTTSTTSRTTMTSPVTYGYRQVTGGASYVPVTPQMANRSCSPQSNRQIQNGFCASSVSISQKCRGIQISPSLDCTGDEYCCYQGSEVMDLRPGGACIPQTNPQILNGVCVDNDQISVSCRGVQMSTSRNCKPDQFCCYNTNDAYAWGWTSKAVVVSRVKLPEGSCKPNRQRDTTSTNGICIELTDVMDACKRWQVARSDDCRASQYCCFSPDNDGDNTTDTKALPNEQFNKRIGNRDALLLAMAAKQAAVTSSVYSATVGTLPTRPPSTTTTSPVPSRSCRPMSYSNLNNGICVDNSQISIACNGIQVSPSLNCYASELCCFTAPSEMTTATPGYTTTTTSTTPSTTTTSRTTTPNSTTTTYTIPLTTSTTTTLTSTRLPPTTTGSYGSYSVPAGGNCIPDSLPILNNGTCVSQENLSSACGGIQISTSDNCHIGDFCCFSMLGIIPTTMGTTNPSTAARTTTSPTTSTTTSTTASTTTTKSTTTTTSPNNQTCRPETPASPLIQGRCVAQGAMSKVCDGLQISASLDCNPYEYCCFTPVVMAVTSAPVLGYCIPDVNPTSSDGLCVESADLARLCAGRDLSTSLNCAVTQLCCYGPAASSMTSVSTTTTTAKTVTTTPVKVTTTPPTTTTMVARLTCRPGNLQDAPLGGCFPTSKLTVENCGVNFQVSSSTDCSSSDYCCYTVPAATTTATYANGRDDSVQLPLGLEETRSSGSSDIGPQIPNNWPRFL